MLSDIRTVEYVLGQWGLWARTNRGLHLDYPSISTHERMRRTGGGMVNISDTEAVQVDRVVSRIKSESTRVHEALALYYAAGLPYRQIGKLMGVHHRTASDWVEQGRMFVRGALGAPSEPQALPMAHH
jgi:DNA-directed RNA polymerase specialized sigma24 family protein